MEHNTTQSRKIRVFLSSTFRDMNAERDYLVNYIFPQVDAYCRKRSLEFIPIDLRWGIPEEESRNGLVLNACLEEVDNSRPFFIGILGSRYGWTPGIAELNALGPALNKELDWLLDRVVSGASITEMEIDYGVLRNMKIPHAAFFLRSDEVEIPDDFREPAGSEGERKLHALKDKIRNQKKYPVITFSSPKELGDRLYSDLIAMIEAEFPPSVYDADNAIIAPHELTLERRSRILCDISSARGDFDKWIKDLSKVLLVCGPPGGGTSTVLAYSTRDLRSIYSDNQVIYFDFDSLAPGSRPVDEFLRFMSLERNALPQDKWNMVAIDNTSTLEISDINRLIEWIDDQSDNVHVAFAVPTGSAVYDMLKFRYDCPTSTINGYTEEQRREIVTNFTAQYGKRLTDTQRDKIVQCKNASDAIVMKMMLESVVAHGRFETLNARIDEIVKAASCGNIFWQLLRDYEKVYANAGLLMEYCYASIAVSLVPEGISEADIMASLDIPQAKWSAIKPGIMRFCKGNNDRIRLVKHGWNHDVKMHWSTHIRAQVGKRISDWYMADEKRRIRGARTISSIYNDIWHLPFDREGKSDNKDYIDYLNSIRQFALSQEAVDNVAPGKLDRPVSEMMRDGFIYGSAKSTSGKSIAECSIREQTGYYLKLGRTLSAFGRNAEASKCYMHLSGVLKGTGDPAAPIYEALALIEVGKVKNALKVLASSGHLPTKGIAALFGKKGNLSGGALRNRILAMALQTRAYSLIGEWEKMQNCTVALFEEFDKVEDPHADRDLTEFFMECQMEVMMKMCIIGSKQAVDMAIDIFKEVDEVIRYLGLGSAATYYYLLGKAIICCRYRSEQNDRAMRHSTYYALRCAERVFGANNDDVITVFNRASYQYNRAANLYAIVEYRQTGKYMDWDNTAFVQNFYRTRDDVRRIGGVEWKDVDIEVKKGILIERDFFRSIVNAIQPEAKRKELEAAPDELRKAMGL